MIATIVIVSLNNASTKGRDARRLEDAKQLRNALQLYYDTYSYYPDTLDLLAPAYIPTVPKDPVGSANYYYDLTQNKGGYHLGMNLERADSVALRSDADTVTPTINGDDGANCSGSTATGRRCYDIKP